MSAGRGAGAHGTANGADRANETVAAADGTDAAGGAADRDGGARPYLRHPHLAAGRLVFCADDEVWLADLADAVAGRAVARRLTADEVPVAHPRLSPDGTWVAWTSVRALVPAGDAGSAAYLPREAYAAPVAASASASVAADGNETTDIPEPRRLTYWADPRCAVRGWVSADQVLVVSAAGTASRWRTRPYAVGLDGRAQPCGPAPAADLAVGADGAVLVGSPVIFEPAQWKGYRGGAGGKIWHSADGEHFTRILAGAGDHLVDPMWLGGRVAFLSDHEGAGALYSALPDGSQLRRHTPLGGFHARHASTDGTGVVYQAGGDLWYLPDLDGAPVRLGITLPGERTGRRGHRVPLWNQDPQIGLDRTGGRLLVTARGTVHAVRLPEPGEKDQRGADATGADATGADETAAFEAVEAAEATAAEVEAAAVEPGVRYRLAAAAADGKTVACVCDRGGADTLEFLSVSGARLSALELGRPGRVLELAVAPDGSGCALALDDGRLLLADPAAGTVAQLAASSDGECFDLCFSPDSALLAWAEHRTSTDGSIPSGLSVIRLARLADGFVADVTAPRFKDCRPQFTADGGQLAFLSHRVFDPCYDTQTFQFDFLPGVRPFLAPLRARAATTTTTATATPPTDEDLHSLGGRLHPLPVDAGRLERLHAVCDGLVWLERGMAGELGEAHVEGAVPDRLVHFRFADGAKRILAADVRAFAVSGDGRRVVAGPGLEVRIFDLEGESEGGTAESARVELPAVGIPVRPQAEWRQMYRETDLLMRDNFWTEAHDWDAWTEAVERYRPLVERAARPSDVLDLLWELQGCIGASHAYVRPAGPARTLRRQGHLGADLRVGPDGRWRIARIPAGEASLAAGLSPSAAPGADVRAGDVVVAVDGVPVPPGPGPAALLAGTAGLTVRLTLERDGAEHDAVVRPAATESELRYQDTIARRRAEVERAGAGRVGYLHVPDMMARGWAQLHRDLPGQAGRDALIVDLRENAGGHTSSLLVARLARIATGWEVSRRYRPIPLPADAPRTRLVVLVDEYTGSDAELAVHALSARGLAVVVGVRTFGGGFGIDERYGLVDGTGVTQPKYAYLLTGSAAGHDNRGLEPDVAVPCPPGAWSGERDPQLEAAVEHALRAEPLAPPAPADHVTGRAADHRADLKTDHEAVHPTHWETKTPATLSARHR